jgi:hypothetical protein
MNAQLDSRNDNGNGDAKSPSLTGGGSTQITTPMRLDLSNPFEESESYDIDQIEGRRNGERAWKLSNGEYVISYTGIMSLSQKHSIEFSDGFNSNTKQVIARARLNGNERVSGKLPIPSQETALELAKRNAARQLLPLAEIKAVERKAKLEHEFDWQKAQAKCVEVVGTKANVDIIIHELVNDGKLRKDNPSHYNRTEWLMIYEACKDDVSDNNEDGGDNAPSSTSDDGCNPNWREHYQRCVDISSINDTSMMINRVMNDHNAKYRKDQIAADDWKKIFDECKKRRDSRDRVQATKSERSHLIKLNAANFIYRKTGFDRIRHHREKAFATGGFSTQITTNPVHPVGRRW